MTTGTTQMYKVTQVATGVAGSPYYLTAYFDGGGGSAQNAANDWRAFLSAGVSTYVSGLIFSAITEVGQIDPVTGDLTALTTVSVASQTFTGAADPMAPVVQGLARWRTGEYLGGREIRGRTSIPRQAETDSTLGVPTSTWITTWQARQATLLASALSNHVVWSPKHGVWALTTGASMWSEWAVLRSRR